jgi:hypothetical protein
MIKYTKEDIEKLDNNAIRFTGKRFDEGQYYWEVAEVRNGTRTNQYCLDLTVIRSKINK